MQLGASAAITYAAGAAVVESLPMHRPAPPADCPLCPRLATFRDAARMKQPDWHNAPVPSFGDPGARLLIVGLAPGLSGANRTGRPFTGDGAGNTLYPALARFGWSRGTFKASPDDGLELVDCRITNAVRCVPPENKPTGQEITTCRRYLAGELIGPRAILALGRIAHDSTLRALGLRPSSYAFAHDAWHVVGPDLVLASSYHCSRYNMNTGRLTEAMFDTVLARLRRHLDNH